MNKAITRVLAVIGVTVGIVAVAAAPVAATPHENLGRTLGELWETVLATPSPQNPWVGGTRCVDLGGATVSPFPPPNTPSLTCTVKAGTRIFVVAYSSECSTIEGAPYFGSNEAELRECARAADAGFTALTVTVDGQPVPVVETETRLLRMHIPADNIVGVDAQKALSVGHGWVSLLAPLATGTHQISIGIAGTDVFGNPVIPTPTTIVVLPRR
jgi:hypothetical protein